MASSVDPKLPDKCSENFENMPCEEISETNILYELLIYSEWQQEPEIHGRGLPERVDEKCIQAWRWLGRFAPTSCPSYVVQKLVNFQMPWQFAVGGSGRVVAILQDQSLEIRSSRDEYGSVIGRSTVSRDPYPQWRKLVWSPDCTMLVLGHSNGNLEFFDLIGANLFTIPKVKSSGVNGAQDFSQAIVGMVFSDIRVKNTQWSYEFLVANYRGKILSYSVSSTDGYQENHSFSFTTHYPNGITALSYHHSSHLLLVGGKPQKVYTSDATSKALQTGITAWRFLSDYPHYKMILSLEDEMAIGKRNWLQKIPDFGLYNDYGEDTVYKLSISPQGDILAAIHTSGALSLWNLPSLRMRKLWDLQLQPNYDVMNPQYCEPGMRRKTASILSDPLRFHIVDVNWWSNEAVILARCCGAVTISSVYSLKNLLGISPEWFEMSPQVSSFNDRGFLAMECESRVTKKRPAKEDNDNMDGDESSDDEESSVFSHTSSVVKRALYFVTDSEKFQPPRKKPRILTKTYRLLCLKSTTPEELYTRKINNEEYGEALALAKAYGLDCDLVYQRQWRKTPVSVASIQDYLSKITKRSWVLHECLERVPETIEAARELLLYGLYGTDLVALITIGKGEDHGRFIICQPEEYYDDFYNIYSVNEEELERKKIEQERKKRLELMKQINFKKLTLEQKQLCQCRLKLLAYLDRLNTYEIILGGTYVAEEHYDHNFFKQFRSQSGLEACLTFAQASNWRAVAAMFTFHGKETLPHRLPILSNFPETTSPMEYHSLLPEVRYKKDVAEVSPWEEDRNREDDWCETKYSRQLASPAVQDFIVDFYEEYKEFMKYRQKLTGKLLTEWFSERAREIESRSNLVDNALELVKLGIERNVKGLEKLLDDLTTLETLVYECHVEKKLSFKYFEEISNFEKLQLLMSMCSEENFLKNVKQWLLPFLDRCEKHEPGCRKKLLKEYLKTSAKNDLIYCRKVLENSLPDQPERIITDMEELMSLALDCIYACERNDQLSHACAILECIPQRGYGDDLPKIRSLHDRLDELEKHLSVAELLENNGTSVTLGYILECWQNAEDVKKLLTKLTRIASRKTPALNETQWRNLLLDILDMQEKLFTCVTPEDCYEIFLQSLLCSGRHDTITLAGCMMECNQKQRKDKDLSQHDNFFHSYKLPYQKSVELVLTAAQEHFNSSANLSDPCMALARACLNLIEDVPSSIEEEHDLISSLSLLQDFNVNVLPLQVRLCSNRLQLVERTIKTKAKSYKNTQKLLQLAYLLRVCGSNNKEREGKVLSLIAEAAFTCKDYNHCFNTCQQLIEGGHQEGWSVCYSLGGCTDFANIPARCKLMSFSLAHCTSDLIEVILKTRTELQLQIIYDRVKFLMGKNFEHDSKEESEAENLMQECTLNDKAAADGSSNTLWQTGEKTLQVLQTTTKTTKAVLTSVGSTQFWKDAVKWIHSFGVTWEDDSSGDQLQNNKDLTRQGVCSFYSGLIENAHISKLETSYFRYSRPDLSQSLEITSSVLRAALLEDTLKEESQRSSVNTAVLLDLAKSYLPEDAVFSLALLLNVKKLQDAEDMFKHLPSTPIVLQFASLYYALRICTRLSLQNVLLQNSEIQEDPSWIIREVIDSTNSEEHTEVDTELGEAFNLLHKYNKMLFDFIQAEILHGIGGGVDAMRFTEDDLYKKETILGIAMTLDDDVFQIAVSLAHHYKLPLWDVYMVHLEYLFGENSISVSHIEARIQQLKLLDVLLTNVDQFRERLKFCVYPNIEGKNHSRLLLYFFILELCGDVPDDLGIKPTTHSKMLKKFRSAVSNLDYKELLNPATSSLMYISSLLNEANVHVFAKSAVKIPDQGGFLEPSAVYCIWGKKYFFEGSGTNKKLPQLTTEWLHWYESCGDILQKLSPIHLLEFINGITFSETALEKLSIDCRTEINKRALKFCKQKSGKRKDDPQSSQWQIVIGELQHNLQHLQRLDEDIVIELRNSADPRIQTYAKEFDLSRALTDKLQQMLIKAVMEGQELSLLQTLLASCPSDLAWEPADIYIQAINLVIAQMKDIGTVLHPYLNENNPIDILERILQDLSKNNDELMIEDMALELLHPFCNDSSVPVHTRLSVLQLLEKTSTLSEEDTDLLLLYRTQTVVSTVWPEFEVTEDNVKEDFQRKQLFDKLIVASTTILHLTSLAELLFCWPPLESASSDDPEINLWVRLLCALSSVPEKSGLAETVRLLDEIQLITTLSYECCCAVYKKVSEAGILLYILKFAFKTKYDKIHDAGVEHLLQYSELKEDDVDEELLSLILEQHLTSKLVSTVLYKPVIEYLFNHQEDMRHKDYMAVNVVVKELADLNHAAEAGSLLLLAEETHPGLTTFSSALSILQKWLSRERH